MTVADSAAERPPTAGAVIIGDEILSGEVADTNGAYLARKLRGLGIVLVRIHFLHNDGGGR